MKPEINYALVEETRPELYTAMKYWGKKPHNIWRKYIEIYTPEDGVYLDPFVGSGVSAFEAVKAGRKAIAFDLNPLSSFLIKVLSSDFNKEKFRESVLKILSSISRDAIYEKYYSVTCPHCGEIAIGQSYKWDDNRVYEIGVECQSCSEKSKKSTKHKKRWNGLHARFLREPGSEETRLAEEMNEIEIPYWHPLEIFPTRRLFLVLLSTK